MLTKGDKEKLLACYDENLASELQQLGVQIGVDNLDTLLDAIGGRKYYIPTQDGFWGKLYAQVRDEEIRARFRGNNLTELCQEYKLSKRQMRRIVNG